MYNDLFTIEPVTIHGYGLMIGLGVIAALWMAGVRAPRKGLDGEETWRVAMVSLAAGLVGAKLLFYLTHIGRILDDPSLLLSLGSGLVVYGGILAGVPAAWLYCKKRKLQNLATLDLLIPSVALAQGFGRIGCFLAGCCYGAETNSWFHIVFTHSDYAPNGVPLVPTQLLSAAGDFLLAGVLLWIAGRNPRQGTVVSGYLVLYGIGRFVLEFWRSDPRGSLLGLSTSQFISLFVVAAGVLLAIYIRRDVAIRKGDSRAL